MNYGNIKYFDISNGPGIRSSIYVSGCSHHCNGCFNTMTWDKDYGHLYTLEIEDKLMKELENKNGLSLLGGEPLENLEGLFPLILKFRDFYKNNKDIWCWTGYTWEQILKNKDMLNFIKNIDVLVDGRFIEDKKDIRLKYKGSTNQRVIDVQQSLLQNKVIILEQYNN